MTADKAESGETLEQLANEQAALRRVATLVAAGAMPAEVFGAAAEEAQRILELPLVVMSRYEADGTATVVAALGEHAFQPGTSWPLDGPSVSALVLATGRPAAARLHRRAGGHRTGCSGRGDSVQGSVCRSWSTARSGESWSPPSPTATLFRRTPKRGLPTSPTSWRLRSPMPTRASRSAASPMSRRRCAGSPLWLRRVRRLRACSPPLPSRWRRWWESPPAASHASCRTAPRSCWHRTTTPASPSAVGGGPTKAPSMLASSKRLGAARVDQKVLSGPIAEASRISDVRSAVAAPIVVEGSVWGMVAVGRQHSDEPLPPEAETRLAAFTELVATAIANAESRDELTLLADEQAALGESRRSSPATHRRPRSSKRRDGGRQAARHRHHDRRPVRRRRDGDGDRKLERVAWRRARRHALGGRRPQRLDDGGGDGKARPDGRVRRRLGRGRGDRASPRVELVDRAPRSSSKVASGASCSSPRSGRSRFPPAPRSGWRPSPSWSRRRSRTRRASPSWPPRGRRIVAASDQTRRQHRAQPPRRHPAATRLASIGFARGRGELSAGAAATSALSCPTWRRDCRERSMTCRTLAGSTVRCVQGGLGRALRELALRSGDSCRPRSRDGQGAREPTRLLRTSRVRALASAAKHSDASTDRNLIEQRDGGLALSDGDDGRGERTAAVRARRPQGRPALGGSLRLSLPPGRRKRRSSRFAVGLIPSRWLGCGTRTRTLTTGFRVRRPTIRRSRRARASVAPVSRSERSDFELGRAGRGASRPRCRCARTTSTYGSRPEPRSFALSSPSTW